MQGATLQPGQVLTSAGVLEPCECGGTPWYKFGDVAYVGCRRCGRRTVAYATEAEALDAWHRGLYED